MENDKKVFIKELKKDIKTLEKRLKDNNLREDERRNLLAQLEAKKDILEEHINMFIGMII